MVHGAQMPLESRWTELCCDRAVMSQYEISLIKAVVFTVVYSETGVCVAFICLNMHL
jgi:hypothetical protein